MEEGKISYESLKKKFVSLVSLDGLLQQHQIAEDFIRRDRNFMKIIREKKPDFKDWCDNIHYESKDTVYNGRTIDKDYGIMRFNIDKNKQIMKKKEEKIREKCKILELDFEKIMETRKIPTIYILTFLPEYLIYLGETERKRTCTDAFGEKYSETRLEYYT